MSSLLSQQFLAKKDIHTQWQSDYLNPDMDRYYDRAFDVIVGRLPSGGALLDAGCGYCHHAARLARGGFKITAMDFSKAALDEAAVTIARRGLTDQITLKRGDVTQLPFPDDSFNAVVCWGVLMHVPHIEAALSEFSRVLKVNGVLVLCETNMRSPDIAIRERAIRGIKKLLGRGREKVTRTNLGLQIWTPSPDGDGGLLVRKTDPHALRAALARLGLHLEDRIAGEFTQAYTNLPSRALKRAAYALNRFYFKHFGLPGPAAINIFFFKK